MQKFLSFLEESRPTRITQIISSMEGSAFEKLIDFHGTINGFAALFRGYDGNAYEVSIKPAEYSDEFEELTKSKKRKK